MKLNLKKITPPDRWPVEREDMFNMLKLDPTNPANRREGEFIEDLIAAATAYFEDVTGRAFITQTLEMELTPDIVPRVDAGITTNIYENLPEKIKIWRPPCQEVLSVTAVDQDLTEHVISPTVYNVNIKQEPAELRLNYNQLWPFYLRGWFKIRFIAGYGDALSDVPPVIRHAIRVTVSQWYASRESMDYMLPAQAMDLVADLRLEVGDL